MAGLASVSPRSGDRLVNRYDLREELGRGGMGRVFRAHDRLLNRDVAIKVLDHAATTDADFQRACAQEARAAARLVHPGIVTIFDIGVHGGYSFLVMELVEGRTLREILADEERLSPARAVEIASQVADALEYAHGQGVIHCDVKPHNIIVTPDGHAKLVDFGIARAATVTGARTAEDFHGSVPYLAPEQVRGERLDARVDVYGLGLVLYEMLTGRPPFWGRNVAAVLAQRLESDPPPPRRANPAVSPELERVVLTALARTPELRYPNAGAFRDALRSVAAGARADTVRITRAEVPGQAPAQGTPVPSWLQARADAEASRVPLPKRSGVPRAAPRRWNPLALGALVIALAAIVVGLGLMLAAVLDAPDAPNDAAGLPGTGWATFTKATCEWSNVRTPPAVCFGERQAGYRVRVMERQGPRWLIWDPETRNVAYVDADALKTE